MTATVANHGETLDELRREIGVLHGKLEERDHANMQSKQQSGQTLQDLRSTVMGLDTKILDLNEKVTNMEKVQLALFEEIKKMKEESIKQLERQSKPAFDRRRYLLSAS